MYEQTARYYDLIHQDFTADIPFIVRLAEKGGDPILELGSGTGRILLPLARLGYQVTGLEKSPAMLRIAQDKIAEEREAVRQRITLVAGDMTAFKLAEDFGLVVIPHNTLMHLEGRQLKRCLETVRRHIKPNGTLFLDVDNPLIMADTGDDDLLLLERTMIDPKTGDTILQLTSSRADLSQQVRETTWIFDSTPPSGGAIQRTIVQVKFHFYYGHEIESALKTSGFRLEAMYGDYEGGVYGEESDRLLAVAVPE